MSFEMEKYFKRMNPDMPMMDAGRILEINPAHSAVAALQSATVRRREGRQIRGGPLCPGPAHGRFAAGRPDGYTDLVCSPMQ